jgi:hypothetical protein
VFARNPALKEEVRRLPPPAPSPWELPASTFKGAHIEGFDSKTLSQLVGTLSFGSKPAAPPERTDAEDYADARKTLEEYFIDHGKHIPDLLPKPSLNDLTEQQMEQKIQENLGIEKQKRIEIDLSKLRPFLGAIPNPDPKRVDFAGRLLRAWFLELAPEASSNSKLQAAEKAFRESLQSRYLIDLSPRRKRFLRLCDQVSKGAHSTLLRSLFVLLFFSLGFGFAPRLESRLRPENYDQSPIKRHDRFMAAGVLAVAIALILVIRYWK